MEDLDELLSDLENVSNYSNVNLRAKTNEYNSSPSSSTSSSVSFNSIVSNNKLNSNDFIQSINRIVAVNDIYSKPPNKLLCREDSSNKQMQIRDSSNLSDKNMNSKNESLNEETDDDLNELDKLLDDLDTARKTLAMGNSISTKTSLSQITSSEATSTNLYHSDEASTSSSLIPSPSLSSPNSCITKSPNSSFATHLNESTNKRQTNGVNDPKSELLLNDRFDYNSKAKTLNAAHELEKLMASLTMYKNQSEDNNNTSNDKIENDKDKKSVLNDSLKLKNLCRACQMPINGQVITALGYLWHPDHFVCYHCNCSIGTSIFYEKDDQPYCELDYIQLFSPKCAACTTPILDKMLTALNKSWHINCFTCDSCNKLLNDESFLEINNTAYCKECYESELAPKCKRCNQAITENFISALNSYFHPECFVCTECGMPFNQSSFYEYNNMPYCELHYHMKRGSLCGNCQKPINGRCITAMNKKFHPEHFVCSFCLSYLNKGTFKEQNDKPYCHQCFQRLF